MISLLFEKLIIFAATILLANCLTDHKVIQIENGQNVALKSPEYPGVSSELPISLLWTLKSPPGTKITVQCFDVRISPTPNCEKGYFVLKHKGGETAHFCGGTSGLYETSLDNEMILNFELIHAAGVFHCQASTEDSQNNNNLEPTEPVIGGHQHVKAGEFLYEAISLRPIPQEKNIYRWEFTTDEGYKIGIRCPSSWIQVSSREGECRDGRLSFYLGDRRVDICNNTRDLSLVSIGSKLVVTVESYKHTTGMINCVVTSTKGPYFEQFKNEPDLIELDSSEFGHPNKKGIKGTTCNCGWTNKPAPSRILNGIDVSPHEYPWMVGLLPSFNSQGTFCGGTIVTKRHVITAAHCTVKVPATHVVVGLTHLGKREGGQIIAVEKTINHNYVASYATSKDITILILAEDIIFNQYVGPACLPKPDLNLDDQLVIAIGWGGMTENEYNTGRDAAQLKKAKLRVINMHSCNSIWDRRWSTNPQTQICTWHKNRDVCFGDSGGPVVWLDPETNRYTLVGIPSACDGCILEKPAIHTALNYYYPWILDTIKNNVHGEEQVCTKID